MRRLRIVASGLVVACICLILTSSALAAGVKIEPLPKEREALARSFKQPVNISRIEAGAVVTKASIVSGSLPPGVELDASTQVVAGVESVTSLAIAGTPTAPGIYIAEVGVTAEQPSCAPSCPAAQTQSDTQSVSYTIDPLPLAPKLGPLGGGSLIGGVHANVSATIAAEFAAPYESVALSASGLPLGVTAEQVGDSLLLAGHPDVATTSPATITGVFTGAKATTKTLTSKLPVKIYAEAANMLIEPAIAKLPVGESEVEYSLPVSVSGTWTEEASVVVIGGSLPPGLSLDGNLVKKSREIVGQTAHIEGTPTSAGTWTFTLRAIEEGCDGACSTQVTRGYTLKIEPNEPNKVRFLTEAGPLAQGQEATLDFSRMHLTLSDVPHEIEHSIHCTTQTLGGEMSSANRTSPVTFSFPQSTFLGEAIEAEECTLQHDSPAKTDQFLGGRVTISTQPILSARPPELSFQAPTLKSKLGLAPVTLQATTGKLLLGVSFVEDGITCVYQAAKLPGEYQPGELVAEVNGELSLLAKQPEECPSFLAVFGEFSLTSNGEQLYDFS
jgi:hypothetical protein